jgi:hypothetical protein
VSVGGAVEATGGGVVGALGGAGGVAGAEGGEAGALAGLREGAGFGGAAGGAGVAGGWIDGGLARLVAGAEGVDDRLVGGVAGRGGADRSTLDGFGLVAAQTTCGAVVGRELLVVAGGEAGVEGDGGVGDGGVRGRGGGGRRDDLGLLIPRRRWGVARDEQAGDEQRAEESVRSGGHPGDGRAGGAAAQSSVRAGVVGGCEAGGSGAALGEALGEGRDEHGADGDGVEAAEVGEDPLGLALKADRGEIDGAQGEVELAAVEEAVELLEGVGGDAAEGDVRGVGGDRGGHGRDV